MAWVRSGECCKCGDCCRGGIGNLPAQPDGACPFLEREEDGQRLCAIHDSQNTYWSRGCNVWPSDPRHIAKYDRCTFSFVWQDD
jgi:hypothetical protein